MTKETVPTTPANCQTPDWRDTVRSTAAFIREDVSRILATVTNLEPAEGSDDPNDILEPLGNIACYAERLQDAFESSFRSDARHQPAPLAERIDSTGSRKATEGKAHALTDMQGLAELARGAVLELFTNFSHYGVEDERNVEDLRPLLRALDAVECIIVACELKIHPDPIVGAS